MQVFQADPATVAMLLKPWLNLNHPKPFKTGSHKGSALRSAPNLLCAYGKREEARKLAYNLPRSQFLTTSHSICPWNLTWLRADGQPKTRPWNMTVTFQPDQRSVVYVIGVWSYLTMCPCRIYELKPVRVATKALTTSRNLYVLKEVLLIQGANLPVVYRSKTTCGKV